MIAPLDDSGIVIDGFGSLTGRDVRDVTEPIVEHLKREDRFYRLETIHHRYPHCWRCKTPLVFRLVDEWYISMGPVYDKPRAELTVGRGRRQPPLPDHGGRRPDPLDPGLRLRPRARLADEHARLDDQQEALLGPGPADLRLQGVRHVRRRRRSRGAPRAGGRRLGAVRGPHAAPAVHRRGEDRLPVLRRAGRADPRRRQPVARRRDRAVLDAPLPRGPRVLAPVVPGRLHHRELPRPVPQLVLLDAGDVDGPPPRAAVQDDLRLRPRLRRGRPADAQELGQRDRVRRGGRADGRRRHALDVRQGAARGEHPLRLARRRRGAARAARALERLRVLRHLRPAGRVVAGRRRPRTGPRPAEPSSTAGSCRGRRRPRLWSAIAWPTSTPSSPAARSRPTSTTCRPGTCACRASGSRGTRTPPTETPRSRPSTARSSP